VLKGTLNNVDAERRLNEVRRAGNSADFTLAYAERLALAMINVTGNNERRH
jgi:hypothetical protein